MAANDYYPDVDSEEEDRLPDDLAGLVELLIWSCLSLQFWIGLRRWSDYRANQRGGTARYLRAKINVSRITEKLRVLVDKEVSCAKVYCPGIRDHVPVYVLHPPGHLEWMAGNSVLRLLKVLRQMGKRSRKNGKRAAGRRGSDGGSRPAAHPTRLAGGDRGTRHLPGDGHRGSHQGQAGGCLHEEPPDG